MTDRIQHLLSAWKGHEDFAVDLVKKVKPNVTVDLGVDYGFSTFALALPNIGTVYGIDWFQGDQYAGERDTFKEVMTELKQLKLDNVVILKDDFSKLAKRWKLPIDILHIDGDHDYESVKKNFEEWAPFVKPTGVILIHDTESFKDKVGRFYAEISDTEYFKYNFLHSHGLGVLTKDKLVFGWVSERAIGTFNNDHTLYTFSDCYDSKAVRINAGDIVMYTPNKDNEEAHEVEVFEGHEVLYSYPDASPFSNEGRIPVKTPYLCARATSGEGKAFVLVAPLGHRLTIIDKNAKTD